MRHIKLIILLIIATKFTSVAQPSPVEYMNIIGENYHQISKDTWDYIKQATKGRNASKIDKRRVQLVSTLDEARKNVSKVKSFKGDLALRDATISYLNISYLVLNSDYKNIVDLEKIAEDSYDAMEAYLMTKEAVNTKMSSAYQELSISQKSFAEKYNITLVENETKLSKKLGNASSVNAYNNKIYLLFFKSYWYEQQMIRALSTNKVSDIEQYRQSLELYSKEGLVALKSISQYQGDNSLKQACYDVLSFHQSEATKHIPQQIDFYSKNEKMESVKKNFESKKKKDITQADIDEYNKAIKDFNEAITKFNKSNKHLNEVRSNKINSFNKSTKAFYNKFL